MSELERLREENRIMAGLLKALWHPQDTFAQHMTCSGVQDRTSAAAVRFVNRRDAYELEDAIAAAAALGEPTE